MTTLTKQILLEKKLPEIVISNSDITLQVSRLAAAGKLIKIAPKLYTSNKGLPIDQIVSRNCWQIVAWLFPGSVISDRTALENKPASDGSICLVSTRQANYQLPGLMIRPRLGEGPTEEDTKFIGGLFLSCPGRAYLENMRGSRSRDHVRRTLTRSEVETKLELVLRTSGEQGINNIRDQAKRVAPQLNLLEELESLQKTIGALLGTHKTILQSPLGRARQEGQAYDPNRIQIFTELWTRLKDTTLPPLSENKTDGSALPFFEAYFSNFIEGTQFDVEEAKEIIFENKIPKTKPADAHDIIGTFRIVSDTQEMQQTPKSFEELETILLRRHAMLLQGRPEMEPGKFKTEPNKAGSTTFVNPDLVRGTLKQGFDFYQALDDPFSKALFLSFLIAEVHPFTDGNGRMSRIMLNSELVAAQQQRIIIPTVYRTEYLQSLKAISNQHSIEPFIKVMKFAQEFTHEVDFSSLDKAQEILTKTNAFKDPADAMGDGDRLIKPSSIITLEP